MNKFDKTVDAQLRAIRGSCPRLLNALRKSPEAVLGELRVMEGACRVLQEARGEGQAPSETATKMMTLVATLRCQMAKQDQMDYRDFALFRERVSAIGNCAKALRGGL